MDATQGCSVIKVISTVRPESSFNDVVCILSFPLTDYALVPIAGEHALSELVSGEKFEHSTPMILEATRSGNPRLRCRSRPQRVPSCFLIRLMMGSEARDGTGRQHNGVIAISFERNPGVSNRGPRPMRENEVPHQSGSVKPSGVPQNAGITLKCSPFGVSVTRMTLSLGADAMGRHWLMLSWLRF